MDLNCTYLQFCNNKIRNKNEMHIATDGDKGLLTLEQLNNSKSPLLSGRSCFASQSLQKSGLTFSFIKPHP